LENLKVVTNGIQPVLDADIGVALLTAKWLPHEPIYFQSYKTEKECKDLLFGVPLIYAAQGEEDLVPLFVKKVIPAIEEKGADTIGIYRVAGNKSDFDGLKRQVEEDIRNLDLMNPEIDVHVLTGLLKQFVRELPGHLFPFSEEERKEYALITSLEERITKLQERIFKLPSERFNLLRILAQHLKKIAEYHEKTKMPLSNLALIFTGAMFQTQARTETKAPAIAWFQSSMAKKSSITNQMESLEFMKNDIVIEDLITNVDILFNEKGKNLILERPTTLPSLAPTLPPRHSNRDSANSANLYFETRADIFSNSAEELNLDFHVPLQEYDSTSPLTTSLQPSEVNSTECIPESTPNLIDDSRLAFDAKRSIRSSESDMHRM
jgi:hypothetical protein